MAARRFLRVTALAALLAATAGCGGGDDGEPGATGAGTDTTAPPADGATTTLPISATASPAAPSPSGGPGGGATTTSTAPAGPSSGGSSGPGAGGGGTTTTQRMVPLKATLAHACVRPGTSQTLTVESDPTTPVAYGATYADGKTGMDQGYYGGANGGKTDDKGTYRDTWVVAANAPPGPVDVYVTAVRPGNRQAEVHVGFEVANLQGTC